MGVRLVRVHDHARVLALDPVLDLALVLVLVLDPALDRRGWVHGN